MLCPAGSSPVSGLTLKPGAAPGVPGTVIVNVTGPPCAVSVKVALEPGCGSRMTVGDTPSVPADGDGEGDGDRDGEGDGDPGRVAVGPGAGEDAPGRAGASAGGGAAGLLGGDAAGGGAA